MKFRGLAPPSNNSLYSPRIQPRWFSQHNISMKSRPKYLAPDTERLLLEWANLPETHDRFAEDERRLLRRYPEIFSGSARDTRNIILSVRNHLRAAWDAPDSRVRDWYIFRVRQIHKHYLENRNKGLLKPIIHRDSLESYPGHRSAAMDSSTLEAIARAIGDPFSPRRLIWSEAPEEPPSQTPFERIMSTFHRIGARAAHCKYAECPTPYFFRDKNNQKYCSPECAAPAERESKRRWWNENKDRVRPKSK